MSTVSGIALVSRNSSATRIGGVACGLSGERAVLVDLLLRRLGLLLQVGGLAPLRRDEQEVAGQRVHEQPDDDARDDGS